MLQDDQVFTTRWPLGKIVGVHKGADGVVRVVSVKTATGVYRRPAVKVALLMPELSN